MANRFCVGDFAVPLCDHEEFPDERFVRIATRGKDKSFWLFKGLGIESLAELPENNLLKRMRDSLEASRGKRTKMMSKVDLDQHAQANKVTIEVDGYQVDVINTLWPIQFSFSEEKVAWLMKGLHADLTSSEQG